MVSTSTLIKPNPALERGFNNRAVTHDTGGVSAMTIDGTLRCTAVLTVILVGTAVFSWTRLSLGWGIAAMLGAFVLAIVTAFRPHLAQYTGIGYAALEGVAVGAISKVYNDQYDGIVLNAAGLTIAILVAMLAIYRARIIKVTENFRLAVAAGISGVMLFYLVSFVVGFFGVEMPLVNSSSTLGIIFSLVVVALAAASLVIDFDFIERGAENGLPKYMEWYGAFGLMVTIVWLYLELLRLLSKLQRR